MEQTQGKSKWAILIIVITATFMSALDGSIVNVALPEMARALHVETSNIQLVAIAYLIMITGTVLIFGRLGDIYGKTKMFRFGLGLFTFGSLLCGLTESFCLLLAATVNQAAGAAATMANSQGIIAETFPVSERGRALGFSGTAVALGSLVGPGLGGLIVGAWNWQYIFLINVPVGIAAMFAASKLLAGGHKSARGKLDGAGAVLIMLAIVPLFMAVSEGLNYGYSDPLILTGFAVSAISLAVFVHLERKTEDPLIQLQIFGNKLFSLSIFCGFITFIAIFCSNIILPFYLQDVLGYPPQSAGLIMMIYPIILTVAAPASGHLSDKIGSELLTFIGLLLISLGLYFMSTLNEHSSLPIMLLFIAAMSLGMGLFQSPNIALIMSAVSRDKLGVAGSINALVRNMGMVCGISLATTLLYRMMSHKLGYRVTDFVAGNNDAFIYGMRIVYVTAAAICFAGALLTLVRLVKRKPREVVVD
jgi:EmrB/QacA subfamily drug resistance transporter